MLSFFKDLNAIAETIKQRTVQQIKAALQKKAFDDAGIAIQSISGPANNQKLMQGGDAAGNINNTNNVADPDPGSNAFF
jgi:hypothetical protein